MKLKTLFTILFSILFAILLGVYAQSIAGFFGNDLYMIMLTIITIKSIGLFAVATITQLKVLITSPPKSRITSSVLTVLLFGTIAVGLYVSWWSLFVLAMSWG